MFGSSESTPPPPEESKSILQRILPFTSVAIFIAALYVAYTFYSRWSDDKQAREDAAEKQREDAKRTYDLLGGGQFKILNFYASPGAIKRGQPATMCYGVSGTKAVHIEPGVEPVKPAITNCLQVSPRKTTQYTLTAEDGKGHTATESFSLQVVP